VDFSASNTALWNSFIQLGILSGILLAANVLRRKVPLIRKSLMPTAVLGGFLAMILRMSGIINIDGGFLESITYHTIALGFIALSLRVPEKNAGNRKGHLTAPKSGALIVSTYLVQGIIGIIITAGLAYTVMPGLFKAAGVLLPMGYGQGPGQANNVGATYEQLGFKGGQSFGLSIAAAGFLCACVVGVIYLNILHKQKKIVVQAHNYDSEPVAVEDFQNDNEIPISQSIDRLSIQTALVLLVYLAAYLVSLGATSLLGAYAPGLSKTLSPLIWGFNFIIGSLIAMLFKKALNLLTACRIMVRQYPNNYLLNRISGCAFDFMIVAGIAAIDIKDLKGLWLPFFIMAVAGGWITFIYLEWLCKKLYPGYFYEGMLSMYGMLTGTISSGVLLLREIDPTYKTPAANNLLTGSSFAIVFGVPMLVLIGLAPESDASLFITLGLMVIYLILLLLFMLKFKPEKDT